MAEARRRERRQCWFESSRDYQLVVILVVVVIVPILVIIMTVMVFVVLAIIVIVMRMPVVALLFPFAIRGGRIRVIR